MSNKIFFLLVVVVSCISQIANAVDAPTRYLAFQIFTLTSDSDALHEAFPPQPKDLRATVTDLRDRIGTEGTNGRRIGVVLGPLSFDNSDDEVRKMIAGSFDIALETDVAIGFHIDDSMFWGRRKDLNTSFGIECLDWQGTPNTGRRLDWSSKPMKIMPQLCVNSEAIKGAVSKRAMLIGSEIAKGLGRLHSAHRDDLFLGVIAGWETQIGRDFDTGEYLGYCALTNAGYSAKNPPADMDGARSLIVAQFIGFWADSLIQGGVPPDKIFSHIAFMSSSMYRMAQSANPAAVGAPYLEIVNFTPPQTAFCTHCMPGLSTYPQAGLLEQWQEELGKHGNPSWASSEGTALDPAQAEHAGAGVAMEGYLGNLFNHGAVLVNVFGWGVGDDGNPFRKVAESPESIAVYQKFLRGKALREAPLAVPVIPPAGLAGKIHAVQAKLPGWIEKNGPSQVKDDAARLSQALEEKHYDIAGDAADALLKTMGN